MAQRCYNIHKALGSIHPQHGSQKKRKEKKKVNVYTLQLVSFYLFFSDDFMAGIYRMKLYNYVFKMLWILKVN